MAANLDSCQSIRVLSLNCWGLKFLSKHRRARLAEIGVQIASAQPQPDIVGLQECWTQEDFLAIRQATKSVLAFGKYYHSGIFGGGLVILSRWPIEESSMYRYPLNGRPTAFFRGDWFVGKGVACAKIRIGPVQGDIVEVFCTHLHAPYEREPNDSYICHRTAQAWEIAKLMRGASEKGHTVIGLGDFNMVPSSLAHKLIETHGRVSDTWKSLHPNASAGATENEHGALGKSTLPEALFNITENGVTCDSVYNTWRWDKPRQRSLDAGNQITVEPDTPDPRGKRLDYIFYANGSRDHPSQSVWTVETANVGMLTRHPKRFCSLSDHFSVEVSFSIAYPESLASAGARVGNGSEKDRQRRLSEPPPFLSISVYDEIIQMIRKYSAREHRQRRLRLAHFVVSLIIFVVLLIAIFWSPHNYVAFLLLLISTINLSAGVIDGLIGGLFVGSELRALREFEWEICNAREQAVQYSPTSEAMAA